MRDRLKIMDQRYEEINRLLSDPQIVSDIKQLTALSRTTKFGKNGFTVSGTRETGGLYSGFKRNEGFGR